MSSEIKLLKDLRVTDLKSELEKRGLSISGLKADLVGRLQKHLQDEGVDCDTFDFNSSSNENEEEKKEKAPIAEETMEEMKGGEEAKEDAEMVEQPKDAEEDKLPEPEKPAAEQESTKDEADSKEQKKQAEKPKEEDNKAESVSTEDVKKDEKDNNVEDDSINLMLDEDNLFDEDNKKDLESGRTMADTLPKTASPPRPETAPVVQPFTSRDTIIMASRSNKAPSENSSMRVAIDESESVGTQESIEGDKPTNGDAGSNSKEATNSDDTSKDKKNSEELEKSACVWISDLSSSTRAADLKSTFLKHGKVVNAKIVSNSRSPGSKCFGLVTMGTPEEAVKCIAELNKTELNGKTIIVEKCKPNATGPPKVSYFDLKAFKKCSLRPNDQSLLQKTELFLLKKRLVVVMNCGKSRICI